MPSFGVSTMSPKKSSLFNIFSTLAIAFDTCRNRHHMKNNIRYSGNTNNTFVMIFLSEVNPTKTPSDGTLLGRTSSEIFVMFIFVFDFVVVLHSLLLM